MIAMSSPYVDDAEPASTSSPTLTASGFTPAQAVAIAVLVHEETAVAVEALEHELARWHVYLSLYMLVQIGIVPFAILLAQAVYEPPRAASIMGLRSPS
ncbi:hypothetical protein MKK68_07765 [Methylobacterium sp. E-016]|uniref:hypothetical protein n=1 Tax=Methylobacterium sp. E-016 TaxID=2836556 RepID=UPI001FB945B3|nr:hypothetical protein [Methylobacterium sp. E-016]MCJ2075551.1 hypothetical protein [Methylobacterium sp. E-016]